MYIIEISFVMSCKT